MKTFVIAEAGANHNRDWKTAKRLVYAAASAGASAVKFQNYTSTKLYAKDTPDFGVYKDIPSLISSIELPKDWCLELKKVCDDANIEFMSTPFDEDAVDLLYKVGVKRMKIAAFESSDPRLVRHVAETKLPIIFSAGIGIGLEKVREILGVIESVNPCADVTVLHCNSSYPTPYSDINLGQISRLLNEFGTRIRVGLSDHTLGTLIPPVAVALGAVVVEKHFTISRELKGPDHPFAIEPDELVKMCRDIRNVEVSLGFKNENSLSESERKNEMNFALRSVVASRDIRAGEVLSQENLTTKRPYIKGNISADQFDNVVNSFVATVDIMSDTMLRSEFMRKVK